VLNGVGINSVENITKTKITFRNKNPVGIVATDSDLGERRSERLRTSHLSPFFSTRRK
jgi:hypothetical protein